MAQPKISRRGWLSWFLQKRRRERAAADAIVSPILLTSNGHGYLTWTCSVTAEFGFTIGYSTDGDTWDDFYDNASPGQFIGNESGTPGFFRIALIDSDWNVVLPYSNVVYSDGL